MAYGLPDFVTKLGGKAIKVGILGGLAAETVYGIAKATGIDKDDPKMKWFIEHMDNLNDDIGDEAEKVLGPDAWDRIKNEAHKLGGEVKNAVPTLFGDLTGGLGAFGAFFQKIFTWLEDFMDPAGAAQRKKDREVTEQSTAMREARKLDVHDANKIDDVLKLDPAAQKYGFDDAQDMNYAAAVLKTKTKGEEEYVKQAAAQAAERDDSIKNAKDPNVAFLNREAARLKLDPKDIYLGHKVAANMGYRESGANPTAKGPEGAVAAGSHAEKMEYLSRLAANNGATSDAFMQKMKKQGMGANPDDIAVKLGYHPGIIAETDKNAAAALAKAQENISRQQAEIKNKSDETMEKIRADAQASDGVYHGQQTPPARPLDNVITSNAPPPGTGRTPDYRGQMPPAGPPPNIKWNPQDGSPDVNLSHDGTVPLHMVNETKRIFETDEVYRGGHLNAKGKYKEMTLEHATFVQQTGVDPAGRPVGNVIGSEDKINGKVVKESVTGTPPKEHKFHPGFTIRVN